MGLIKSKEERQRKRQEYAEKLLNDFLEVRNLEGLSDEDKNYVDIAIKDSLESMPSHFKNSLEAEVTQIDMLLTLIEQNWLVIKLLNEINKKLDK